MIRRLFYAPRVIVLVATIGIAGLALAIVTAYPEIDRLRRLVPGRRSTRRGTTSSGVQVTGAQLAILVVVPIVDDRARLVPQPHARSAARSRRRPRTPTSRACRASTRRSSRPRSGRSPASLATLTMMLVAGRQRGAGERSPRARPEHAGARAGRGGDRGHGVVPARHGRRRRDRCGPGAVQLQLPRQARPHRPPAPASRCSSRWRSRAAAATARRRRPSRSPRRCARSPSNLRDVWWVQAAQPRSCSARCSSLAILLPLRDHRAVAPAALRAPSAASRSARCRSRC